MIGCVHHERKAQPGLSLASALLISSTRDRAGDAGIAGVVERVLDGRVQLTGKQQQAKGQDSESAVAGQQVIFSVRNPYPPTPPRHRCHN
jgi:hypothetical protein